jgi:hypothetical protein
MLGNDRFKLIETLGYASDWEAVYVVGNDDIVKGKMICWAVVEDRETKERSIVGMVLEDNSRIEPAPSENFLGYDYPRSGIDWKEVARRKREQQKEQ